MAFDTHEIIVKLICRHCYHSECLNDYVLSESQPVCPVCAGPCRISDRFRYDGPTREESFSSVVSTTLPWFTADGLTQPAGYFYAKTELRDGRPAALIDP